ncbi:MAG: acetyltransferase [Bryobacterales bacterium]|nr:acetyltransferase [Bryobacterales bacterium]
MERDRFPHSCFASAFPLAALLWTSCLAPLLLPAQEMLTPAEYTGVNIPVSDLAIFEAGIDRSDLRCKVERADAVLGFDMNFHAGYQAELPLSEVGDGENTLSVLFRIYPVERPKEKRYFLQRFRVPEFPELAEGESPKGNAYLEGSVLAGAGKYKMDWLMRDRRERVCASSWTFDVEPYTQGEALPITLTPGVVRSAPAHPFQDFHEVTVPKDETRASLHVKLLVHFAPLNLKSATLQPVDLAALLSIVRSVARDERVGQVSLVVFNVREQRVLYRQTAVDRVDYGAVGKAIDSLQQGTIRYSLLADKNSDTRFLTNLITAEMSTENPVDAMIFVGPKVLLEENPPKDMLSEAGEVQFPLFYVNYNLNPRENPWRDAIGHAVKYYRGAEFTVYRPQDLYQAVRKMFTEIEDYRTRKVAANPTIGQ